MELKDKISIVSTITGVIALGVGVSTFLVGPGVTKAAISVDYTVESNVSFTAGENPMQLNIDAADSLPHQKLENASLHITVTHSNKGTTPASIGRLIIIATDADISQTCSGDPENGTPVHILNPEGQSVFAQQGKIPAGDIERANYEVRLFHETEQKTYPKHALICAIINGTDSNISTRQAVVPLGLFNYENTKDFIIGTNPTYMQSSILYEAAPRHLLP